MELTQKQNELIQALQTRRINAHWNDRFLNCHCSITKAGTGKKRRVTWGITFDDPATLSGARVCNRNRDKAYVEGFSRETFFECLRVGGGEAEALRFVNECREGGLWHGAPQSWIEQHAGELVVDKTECEDA